ncbi:MAG: SLC13 family permease [Pseudohongiellaceae bacterium]
MSADQIILLVILAALLGLLVWGRWRYDIVALGALFSAGLFGIVPQSELFSGFGNPATITVVLVLIISFGLTRSGAVDYVLPVLEPFKDKPMLHTSALTFLAAFLSMFMNNVGALALLMPIAIQSTSKAGRAPATVLMPLSLGSILGGLVTLIGTPPNILVASYREEVTGEAFSMFDFSAVGGGVAMLGILFLLLVGWRLVPVRKKTAGLELFEVEEYLFELKVTDQSPLIGEKAGALKKALKKKKMDLLSLEHNGKMLRTVQLNSEQELHRRDFLMIQGTQEDVAAYAESNKLSLHTASNGVHGVLHSEDKEFAEVIVTPESLLLGETPSSINLNTRFKTNLIAASRSGKPHNSRLRDFKFKVGDVLLLYGEEEQLQEAVVKLNVYPLAQRSIGLLKSNKALWALAIFVTAIALVASGLLSIQLALGAATVAMALGKIIPIREFYQGVDWPVVVLLGAMIPLGAALESTGTTDLLVAGILAVAGDLSPVMILVLILVITMTVSDVLNNAATAILMAPIAYNLALSLGLNPDAFLMAVAVGASCAFLTPIGHQNNALIMGAGGYQFGDYWRVGLPLEIIIVAVATPLLLLAWPL